MNSLKRRLDKLMKKVSLPTAGLKVIFIRPGRDSRHEIEAAERAGHDVLTVRFVKTA
jgi:hypothetical protein